MAAAEYFLTRLNSIEALVEDWQEPWGITKEDIDGLLEEVLVWARSGIDFNGISARLEARRTLDFASLQEVHSILGRVRLPLEVTAGTTKVVPATELGHLESALRSLEEKYGEMSASQVAGALSLRIGGTVNRLLYAAAECGTKIPDLVELVRAKLGLLVDTQVGVLWSVLQKELDPESMPSITDHTGILKPGWLKYEGPDKARDKLAAYVVELKPKLLVEAAKQGHTAVPLRVPALVDVASWKSASAADRLTEQEVALARCVGRLEGLMGSLPGRDAADLEMALGLLPQSRLLKQERPLIETVGDQPPKLRSVCYEIRKFVLLVDYLLTRHRPIQSLLHQFKLGLEVMAPDICSTYGQRSELQLQRELVRFLVERGTYGVGTKFGSYETDLVIGEHADHYVVEVKKFRSGDSITEGKLKAAFVQLQSYMDEPPTHPLGMLLVFNFSDSLLVAPRTWIRGRYWILVVNLQAQPPSGRKKSITVDEGSDDETIGVHVTNTGPGRKASKARAKKPKNHR
jgi:hypothetical protein